MIFESVLITFLGVLGTLVNMARSDSDLEDKRMVRRVTKPTYLQRSLNQDECTDCLLSSSGQCRHQATSICFPYQNTETKSCPHWTTPCTSSSPAGNLCPVECVYPWDAVKFQDALKRSALQAPYPSPALVNYGEFEGFESEWFRLVDSQYIEFSMSGNGKRSELRLGGYFFPETNAEKHMWAVMKIGSYDTSQLLEFTLMQVHTTVNESEETHGPPLRIYWVSSRDGLEDQIWAGLRTSYVTREWIHSPLGKRPDGFFRIDVTIVDSKITISLVNTENLNAEGEASPDFHNRDISYYNTLNLYFKCGTYISRGDGSVSVQFDQIIFPEMDFD